MARERDDRPDPQVETNTELLLENNGEGGEIDTTETLDTDPEISDNEIHAVVRRLRDMRAYTLTKPFTEPNTEELLDTDGVETEAEITAAGEAVSADVRTEVEALYKSFLSEYSYVKEANDKFLATLEQALDEDPIDQEEIEAIRNYAESLLLDPVNQRMVYTEYDQEDIVDEALDLTNREAWMDVDIQNENNRDDVDA
ncbi:hypothetical protein [Leptolyngbya sp. FACHB-261]|uniref:hypothetical protein n=1 Tax=Leptolyngbya sp. FACHB-261 TaxID=2692806 RepID=UPI0016893B4E|nr:hypothetical protein [Leptolyngbya sp. FACHB-261]MBD2104821.1 hypothetical protein [Leptolyngbya sp. FACHB-261]